MKTSLNNARLPRRLKVLVGWLAVGLPMYLLSTGPVAWATNDAYHPAYLPDQVWYLYLPLAPLLRIDWANQLFYYYTAVLWDGFPAGYTTL